MTEVRIIGGRSGSLRPRLFRELAEAKGSRRIVFVPEQYTLQAERDLITGMRLPGLLDLEVISPTKLRTLVRESAGFSGRRALDETGRAMAIQRALSECGSALTFYRDLTDLGGAVPRMDKTLSELREAGLTPEDLEQSAETAKTGARRAKYRDLAMIWRAYDALMADRFEDPAGAWEGTCARLTRSGLWNGARVWIYGFDTVRPDLRRLILAASERCEAVTVMLTMTEAGAPAGRIFRPQRESCAELLALLRERGVEGRTEYLPAGREQAPAALRFLEQALFTGENVSFAEDPGEEIRLFAAAGPTAEARDAVTALMAWHEEGIPWKRMAVALPASSPMESALTAALRSSGIPFFSARKDSAMRHGVCRLLCGALECAAGGYRTEPVIRAAASGFGTLTREEAARLENYAVMHGIDHGRWTKPFTRGEDAAEMEACRLRFLAPVEHLRGALRAARTAAASVEAVVDFLREEGVYGQLRERQAQLTEAGLYAEAVVDRQIWEMLMELLDQLWALLGNRRAGMREMARLVAGALERSRIASLPEEEEGVTIGEIGHMLPGETDALILAGMNDGVMNVGEEDLLSDTEKRGLKERSGMSVGLDRGQMAMIIRADYYRTMTLPEKRLRMTYSLRQEDGTALTPGEPAAEIRRLFPMLSEEGGVRAEGVPEHPWTPRIAMEGIGPRLRDLLRGEAEDLDGEWKEALRLLWTDGRYGPTLRETLRRALPGDGPARIRRETALRLFRAERTSISRLESYAACPYRFFVDHGLRPVSRDAWSFSAADAGDFFHAALQRYLDRADLEADWPNLSAERVEALMDDILEELTRDWADGPLGADAGGAWQGEEYIRRVRHAASVLTRFAANSDFRVVGTEVPFGTGEGLPPLILTLEDGSRVALEGKIDRLDAWRGPDGDYLRVLDLKSGEKELSPAKMESGEQLQLMIYLKTAEAGRPGETGAGAMYFPVQDREVSAGTPEEAEEERIGKVRFRGVALAEESVIRAMDRERHPWSIGKVFKQDGTVSKAAPWAVSESVLRELKEAAVEKAAELCGRIRAGEIPVSPSAGEDGKSACSFCDYACVCRRRKEDERPLDGELTFAGLAAKNALRKSGNCDIIKPAKNR